MTRANEPAFPLLFRPNNEFPVLDLGVKGMTLREYYAGLAMQGLVTDPACRLSTGHMVDIAVKYADALIKELENGQGGNTEA